jgi:hypothetical protein
MDGGVAMEVEDVSEEAIAKRHTVLEKEEQTRYLIVCAHRGGNGGGRGNARPDEVAVVTAALAKEKGGDGTGGTGLEGLKSPNIPRRDSSRDPLVHSVTHGIAPADAPLTGMRISSSDPNRWNGVKMWRQRNFPLTEKQLGILNRRLPPCAPTYVLPGEAPLPTPEISSSSSSRRYSQNTTERTAFIAPPPLKLVLKLKLPSVSLPTSTYPPTIRGGASAGVPNVDASVDASASVSGGFSAIVDRKGSFFIARDPASFAKGAATASAGVAAKEAVATVTAPAVVTAAASLPLPVPLATTAAAISPPVGASSTTRTTTGVAAAAVAPITAIPVPTPAVVASLTDHQTAPAAAAAASDPRIAATPPTVPSPVGLPTQVHLVDHETGELGPCFASQAQAATYLSISNQLVSRLVSGLEKSGVYKGCWKVRPRALVTSHPIVATDVVPATTAVVLATAAVAPATVALATGTSAAAAPTAAVVVPEQPAVVKMEAPEPLAEAAPDSLPLPTVEVLAAPKQEGKKEEHVASQLPHVAANQWSALDALAALATTSTITPPAAAAVPSPAPTQAPTSAPDVAVAPVVAAAAAASGVKAAAPVQAEATVSAPALIVSTAAAVPAVKPHTNTPKPADVEEPNGPSKTPVV